MLCNCCHNELNFYNNETKVYKCSFCNSIYRDYSHIDLDKFYQDYRKTYKLYSPKIRLKYCKNLINVIKKYLDDTKDIIEIGSADGFFSDNIKKIYTKMNIICCEKDKNFIPNLKNKGYKTIIDIKEYQLKVDTIIMIDLLEHINDVYSFSKVISNISKKYIIIQIPINRRIYYSKDFDGHFHFFTLKAIGELFSKFKFSIVFSKETSKRETANGPELIVVLKNNQ